MAYAKSLTKAKVLNLIPKPDDDLSQDASEIVISSITTTLNMWFGQGRTMTERGYVDISSLPSSATTPANINKLFQQMITGSNNLFEKLVMKKSKKTKEEKKKDKKEKRKAEKKERKQQMAASKAFQPSDYRESRTIAAEPYVADGAKVAEDYPRMYVIDDERSQKDFAAKCFTNFMYYVAATMLQCAPKKGQPKRVILPIRQLNTDHDDSGGSLNNLALEIREPNDKWQKEELFRSGKKYEAWTERSFARVLGSAMISNEDVEPTIDDMHERHNNMTKIVCGKQYHRRFAWGFVVKGSRVEIKRSGYKFTSMTTACDLTTWEGREVLIDFLVNMSYCDEHKLGLDPTVKYLPNLQCWEIAVPDKGKKDRVFYGYNSYHFPIYKSEYGFSKYMIAKTMKPTAESDGSAPTYSLNSNDVTIKDVWRVGDEAAAVKKALEDETNKGISATFIAGGMVQIDGHDDSVKYILGEENVAKDKDKIPREHHRVAIRGIVEIQDKREDEFIANKECLII